MFILSQYPHLKPDANGELLIENIKYTRIVEEHGTPTYVYSLKRIKENATKIKEVLTEIGCESEIFYSYILEFSKYKPNELKIIIIDNAGFHSLSKYKIPENIVFIRIPPYSPELNHSEKIWAYIKQYYKNKVFEKLENVKIWLHNFIVNKLTTEKILSITSDKFFLDAYTGSFVS